MAVGEGMVGVICSETILGEGAGVGAGPRGEPVPTAAAAAAFWAAPGGMGGFWAELGMSGGGGEEEVGGAFLAGEGRGALERRKPGSDSRLEEERSGPGGGAAPLPRKEKLPPELMATARRFCWKTSRLPCRRRAGWWLSSPRDSRHFLTCVPHSRSIRDSLTGRVTICGEREDRSAEVTGGRGEVSSGWQRSWETSQGRRLAMFRQQVRSSEEVCGAHFRSAERRGGQSL